MQDVADLARGRLADVRYRGGGGPGQLLTQPAVQLLHLYMQLPDLLLVLRGQDEVYQKRDRRRQL